MPRTANDAARMKKIKRMKTISMSGVRSGSSSRAALGRRFSMIALRPAALPRRYPGIAGLPGPPERCREVPAIPGKRPRAAPMGNVSGLKRFRPGPNGDARSAVGQQRRVSGLVQGVGHAAHLALKAGQEKQRGNGDAQPRRRGQQGLPDPPGEQGHVHARAGLGDAREGRDHPEDGPEQPHERGQPRQHGQQGKPRFQPFQHRLPGEAQGGFTVRKGRAQERREVPQGGDGLQPGRQRPHVARAHRLQHEAGKTGVRERTSHEHQRPLDDNRQRRHRDGQQRPHHPAAQFDQPHKLLLYEDGASGREISVPMNTR